MNYVRALKDVEGKIHQEKSRLQSILSQLSHIDDIVKDLQGSISNDAMMLNNNFYVMQEILRMESMKIDYANYYQQVKESIAKYEKKASIIENRLRKDRDKLFREQENKDIEEIIELSIQKKWRD